MVTSKTFERLINISDVIAQEAGTKQEIAEKVLLAAKDNIISRRRLPAPPPPEGGISLRKAERKYNIPNETISRWVRRGWVKIIQRTPNWLYIDESDLVKAIQEHRNGLSA